MGDKDPLAILMEFVFYFWLISIITLFVCLFLSRGGRLSSSSIIITWLTTFNLIAGLIFILSIFFKFLLSYFNLSSLFSLIVIAIIIILGKIFLPNYLSTINLKFEPINAYKIYLSFLTEIVGYPPDKEMATAEEIFLAINNYREQQKTNRLEYNRLLCQEATERLQSLNSIVYTKNYVTTSTYNYKDQGLNTVGEILVIKDQPNSAQHIVEHELARPFSSTIDMIRNPRWQKLCVTTDNLKMAVFFGR